MSLYRGIALVMYDGQPINVSSYRYLGEGTLAGIPISLVIFLAVIALAGAILQFTRFGRHTYAIGSNVEAAHHAGVRVDRTLIGIYTLGGLLTGLGAMIAMSRTVSAQPTAGVGAELDVIAAVVIGGASLSGGRGTITGTIVGTLLISFLRNGCTLVGISTNAQLIVIGVVIVLAVAVDQFTRLKAGDAA
jgi:ribose/xylose/arabinose/galactoside ABC-type transport system permease subunit